MLVDMVLCGYPMGLVGSSGLPEMHSSGCTISINADKEAEKSLYGSLSEGWLKLICRGVNTSCNP